MRNVGIAVLVGSVGLAGLSLMLWLVGLVTGYSAGGFVHLLLVLALLAGPAGLVAGALLIIVGNSKSPRR